MRATIGALAFTAAGLICVALADPPAQAPPAAPQASTPQPSTASAPAPATGKPEADSKTQIVVQSTPEVDVLEKHFLAEGYKMEMHNGEKMFCRHEEELGSRLRGRKVCGTAQQLQATEREAQAAYQRGQSQQTNPKGN